MAFKILKDHVADETEPQGTNLNAVGVYGPRGITEAEIHSLDTEDNTTWFQMYDDDGELYYTGAFLGDASSEDAFEPLECFGEPNAGCTHIKYPNPETGVYEML